MASLRALNQRIQAEAAFVQDVITEIRRVLVGQDNLIQSMLIALLADGHTLIEGVPGLAKTLAVRTLAATLNAQFQRIQFTPDLLPADLVGTQIYNPSDNTFQPRPGPIFANLILADEINRAPAKVQSALLEAMEERQVTLGEITFPMKEPYLVLATQNPVEQEGTYPLPEAQLDRFMLKVIVDYPTRLEEREIINRMSGKSPEPVNTIVEPEIILQARHVINDIHVDERLKDYVLDLVFATRQPAEHGLNKLSSMIALGASPRATLFLIRGAKAHAFLNGRGYVIPEDVKAVTRPVLRHRLLLTFEAQAENISSDQLIDHVLKRIEVP